MPDLDPDQVMNHNQTEGGPKSLVRGPDPDSPYYQIGAPDQPRSRPKDLARGHDRDPLHPTGGPDQSDDGPKKSLGAKSISDQ